MSLGPCVSPLTQINMKLTGAAPILKCIQIRGVLLTRQVLIQKFCMGPEILHFQHVSSDACAGLPTPIKHQGSTRNQNMEFTLAQMDIDPQESQKLRKLMKTVSIHGVQWVKELECTTPAHRELSDQSVRKPTAAHTKEPTTTPRVI